MKILTVKNKKDEKFLRTGTKEINLRKENVKELRKLTREMRKKMNEVSGVGLSANQIGENKKLFVAQIPNEQGKPRFYSIINPVITKKSSEESFLEEGCLSIPETYGLVGRSNKITLTGYTVEGKKIKINAWGFLARVFQHEVDHLEGKLFIDKAKEVYKTQEHKNTRTLEH